MGPQMLTFRDTESFMGGAKKVFFLKIGEYQFLFTKHYVDITGVFEVLKKTFFC